MLCLGGGAPPISYISWCVWLWKYVRMNLCSSGSGDGVDWAGRPQVWQALRRGLVAGHGLAMAAA